MTETNIVHATERPESGNETPAPTRLAGGEAEGPLPQADMEARVWWECTAGGFGDCGEECVAVGNLDNAPDGSNKIAVGSYAGLLRVYNPHQPGYQVEDLMMEVQLGAPILQLAVGRFLANSKHITLAVLHPRSLSVHSLSSGSVGKDTTHFKLAKAYEHALERPARSMVHGSFGGGYDHDQVCIQSMDGQLIILDHDRVVLERKLSRFLLPGALAYSPESDLFVTVSSRMEVDGYKFATLGASPQGGQKAHPDWSVVVGEDVVSLQLGRLARKPGTSALVATMTSGKNQLDIVVVAAHTLLIVQEGGAIRGQKRLDYSPLCATLYPCAEKQQGPGGVDNPRAPWVNVDNLIIGSQTGVLFIYREMELIWSARLSSPAAALRVRPFAGQPGLILSLTFDGTATISYLGTDPPSGAVVSEAKELNYEEMDEEHRRLLQMIRDSSSAGKVEPADGLTLRAQVPPTSDKADEEDPSVVSTLAMRVFVSYAGSVTLENVTLVATCAPPLYLTADTVVLPSLACGNRTPTIVPFTFRARTHELPVSLTATIIATYTTPAGEPRCAACEVLLPFSMIAEPVPPIKASAYKITLETNRAPPPLATLFEDLLAKQPRMLEAMNAGGGTALSVRYQCGLDATVLVSKNSGRLRVQSSSFEGLWLFADELVRRLTTFHLQRGQQGSSEEPYAVLYAEPLPLQEYFELIDEHLRCRIALAALYDELTMRAQQFRVVEKRLLVRLKDRNPAPLQNLELLFEGTYQQLLHLADETDVAQQQLQFHGARLAAGTRLLLLLLRLRFGLNAEEAELIAAYLSPVVDETPDQGWEERTDAAVTHLLRTALSKDSSKEGRSFGTVQLARPADASKLKKHITLVADRLHKGLRPAIES